MDQEPEAFLKALQELVSLLEEDMGSCERSQEILASGERIVTEMALLLERLSRQPEPSSPRGPAAGSPPADRSGGGPPSSSAPDQPGTVPSSFSTVRPGTVSQAGEALKRIQEESLVLFSLWEEYQERMREKKEAVGAQLLQIEKGKKLLATYHATLKQVAPPRFIDQSR